MPHAWFCDIVVVVVESEQNSGEGKELKRIIQSRFWLLAGVAALAMCGGGCGSQQPDGPEVTVARMLKAAQDADFEAYLDCLTRASKDLTTKLKAREKNSVPLFDPERKPKSFKIISTKINDKTATVKVEVVSKKGQQAGEISLRLVNDEWKVNIFESAILKPRT